MRLGHQPCTPICVLLVDLFYFWPPAPARSVVVPGNLVFAHIAQRSLENELAHCDLIRFAAMLGADLYDDVPAQHGIARGLRLVEHVAHRLFHVRVLACLYHHFQEGGVRVLGCGDKDGVDILESRNLFRMLQSPRRNAIELLVCLDRFFPVPRPQVANRGRFDVELAAESCGHAMQFTAPVADPNKAERDAIVRP